jgi:hypothetical protein
METVAAIIAIGRTARSRKRRLLCANIPGMSLV